MQLLYFWYWISFCSYLKWGKIAPKGDLGLLSLLSRLTGFTYARFRFTSAVGTTYFGLVPDGEVSSYLAGEMRVGDRLEVRGPIGGHFT